MLTKKESIKNEVKASKTAKIADPLTPSISQNKKNAPPNGNQSQVGAETYISQTGKLARSNPAKKTSLKTKITVQYDVGFNNRLTIRGKGAGLNWNNGLPLKNIKSDEWVWECETDSDTPLIKCEFKILINDVQYEIGENRTFNPGTSLRFTPRF